MPHSLEAFLNAVFPLSFSLDPQGRFLRVSERLGELVAEARLEATLPDAFEVLRPRLPFDVARYLRLANTAVVLKARTADLVLRGQLVPFHGQAVFVGGPQVNDMEDIGPRGLRMEDFPPHDARLDLLVLIATKNAAIEDANRLADELRKAHQTIRAYAEQLEGELVRQERVASLGNLVAGVAHEINTPLGVAVTAASIVEESLAEMRARQDSGTLSPESLQKLVRHASRAHTLTRQNIDRAADLIRQFKQVAVDQSSAETRTFEVHAYIEQVLTSLQPLLRGHPVHCRVVRDAPVCITTVPGAISQIVTNLLENALVHAFGPQDDGLVTFQGSHTGTELRLVYQDNGVGMAPEVASKVFDPFFTTRRGSGGSGLGMYIVHSLVTDALGGSIRLESAPGEGLRLEMRWPCELGRTAACANQN